MDVMGGLGTGGDGLKEPFPRVPGMACHEANEKFGLNITVELGGAWARNQEKEEAQVDMMEKEAEQTEETSGEEASDVSNDEKPATESV